MRKASSQSDPSRLLTRPRSSAVPFILDVYDPSIPVGGARVVARCDTRSGQVWRTTGPAASASMREIRDAIRRHR
jgi:hypothetical protein